MLSTPPLTAIASAPKPSSTSRAARRRSRLAHSLVSPRRGASPRAGPQGRAPARSSLSAFAVRSPPGAQHRLHADAVDARRRRRGRTIRRSSCSRRPMVEVSAKQRSMTLLGRLRPHEKAEGLHRPALLAPALADRKVENAGLGAQPVGGDADLLAGHVVDLEGEHARPCRRGGLVVVVEDQGAQDVGDAGERARAGAGAGGDQPAGRPRRAAVGRRDGARIAAPVGVTRSPATPSSRQSKPRRISRGRRRRDRQQAVAGAHEAAAARQRRDGPARTGERRGDAAGGDHVHQRIPVGESRGNGRRRRAMPWIAASASARIVRIAMASPAVPARARRRDPRDEVGEELRILVVPVIRRTSGMVMGMTVVVIMLVMPGDAAGRCQGAAGEAEAQRADPPLWPSSSRGAPASAGRTAAASARTRSRRSGKASSMAATNMSPAMPPTASRWIVRHAPDRSMDRDDVGALRDDRDRADRRGAATLSAIARSSEGMISTPVIRRSSASRPVGVELDAAEAHRLQLHLGLPLVDLGKRLGRQRREEPLAARVRPAGPAPRGIRASRSPRSIPRR